MSNMFKSKITLPIILLLIILISVGAYFFVSHQNSQKIKFQIWNQLTSGQKSTLLNNWEDADIKKDGGGKLIIEYKADPKSTLGNLRVYVDSNTRKIIRIEPRA